MLKIVNDTRIDDAVHTCPMHPEVKSKFPANCPICNMALVDQRAVGDAHLHYAPADSAKSQSNGHFDTVPEGYGGTVYTCSMHAEVRHPGPAACPLCSVGLETKRINLDDEGPNPELVDLTRRLCVGIGLSVPLLVLSMGPLIGFNYVKVLFGERRSLWLEFARATPALSVVEVLAPGLFPSGFRDTNGQIGVHFEAAAVIVTLVLL